MTSSYATKIRRVVVSGLAAATMATTAMFSAGAAVAQPVDSPPSAAASCHVGQVPLVLDTTWVRVGPGLSSPRLYTLYVGAGFRITAGPIDNDGIRWWKGHGNGRADGWTPQHNLSCR